MGQHRRFVGTGGADMSSRDGWVDRAKGIGIILVVYGHVARGLGSAGIWHDQRSFALIDDAIYSFHMPLFFFLSGLYFFSSVERRGAGGFLANKADVLLYPYIVWSLLQGAIEVGLSTYTNGSSGFADIMRFPWAPRAQFWFLYGMFFICVACVALRGAGIMRAERPAIPLALFVVAYLGAYVGSLKALQYVCGFGIFFCLGAYYSRLNVRSPRLSAKVVYAITLGMVAVLAGLAYGSYPAASKLIVAVAAIVLIAHACATVHSRIWASLEFLGRESMGIYLMHILAGAGARIVLSKIFHINNLYVHLVVGLVVGLAAPIIARRVLTWMRADFIFLPPKLLSIERRIGAVQPQHAA
jgi:fucose 4-O-acetylase-like acetyltransferase